MNGRLGGWVGLLLIAGCTSPAMDRLPPASTPSLAAGSLLAPAPAPAEVIAPLSIPGQSVDPWSVDWGDSPGRLTVSWGSEGMQWGYAVDSAPDPSLTADQSSSLQHQQVTLAGVAAVLSTVNLAEPDGEVPTAVWVSRRIADGRHAHIWVSGASTDDLLHAAGRLVDQPVSLPAAMSATLTLRGYTAIRQTYGTGNFRIAMLDFCRPAATVAAADAAGNCLQLQLNSSKNTVLAQKFGELYGQTAVTRIEGTDIYTEPYLPTSPGGTGAVQGAARLTSDAPVAQILSTPVTLSPADLLALFDSVRWSPGFPEH